MNKLTIIIFTLLSCFFLAQNVTLNKAEKIHDNKDKSLHYIKVSDTSSIYLGELEVQGIAPDVDIFNQIYTKAKTVGANSYTLKPIESIDGGFLRFNQNHYYINLYYTPILPKHYNQVTIISSASKPITFRINEQKVTLPTRSFYQYTLKEGQINTIVVGQFLGSKINLGYKEDQEEYYFQILPAGLRADSQGAGTLNLKSGDIIKLEKNYAQFLTMIYKELKN